MYLLCFITIRKYHLRCPSQLSTLVPAAMTMPSVLNCCNLFHVACHVGSLNVLQHLLTQFPEILISITQEGFSALHIAIMSNQQGVIKFLIDQLNSIVCSNSPASPVNYSDSVDTVLSKALSVISIEKVCDFVNVQTCLGHTVLHFAAILNHVSILELLLSLPDSLQLDIEAKDKMQFTPLHAATFVNALEAVKCLLDHGANPNANSALTHYTDVLKTPLAQACAFHNTSVFSCLLQNGAVDQDWTALQWSLGNKRYNDCFYQILGSFIKQDDSLSEAIKLQKRKEGVSVSAISVEWNDIPLQSLDMKWLEYALYTCPVASSSESKNVLLNVTSFSASNCGLNAIPLEVFQLTKLMTLNLSNNKITDFPSNTLHCETLEASGWTCGSLENLDLSQNKLTQIPSYIFELPNLTCLKANFNCISNISIKLWTAPKLTEFVCSHNNLTTIPSKWVEYLHCRTKSVSAVKTLPLSRLEHLHRLAHSHSLAPNVSFEDDDDDPLSSLSLMNTHDDTDVFDNNGVDVSSSMVQMALQERLFITGSGGVMIDWNKEFNEETKVGFLVHLDFSHNQLASLPPDFPCLAPKLHCLNVSYNDLTSVCIPRGFPSELNYLFLSHNPLHHINCEKETIISMACTNPCAQAGYRNKMALCRHRSHDQLLKLRVLDLSYCNLHSLNLFMPSQLLKKLSEKLKNYLKGPTAKQSESIPFVMAVASQLKCLDNIEVLAKLTVPLVSRLILKHNNLEVIPECVCGMLALSSLEVNHNPLNRLCKELGHLDNLWHLPLDGLSLKFPPHSVLTQGKTAAIVGFLRSMLQKLVHFYCILYANCY